jgi:hypothetical protein
MTGGQQIRSKWYYERTRGQYLNDKAKATRDGKEKEFLLQYPKAQMVDKLLLAKTEMIFNNYPHLSTKTNQAFPKFAKQIEDKLEKDDLSINEAYFKEAVAKIILTQATDKLIADSDWGKSRRSVRAYIKAYTLAILDKYVKEQGAFINYADIWDRQDISNYMRQAVVICLQVIRTYIESQADETDLRERLGREYTWAEIQKIRFEIPKNVLEHMTSTKEAVKYEIKTAKKQQTEDKGIERQSAVVMLPPETWRRLMEFYQQYKTECTPTEYDILQKMFHKRLLPPSEKQAQVLYNMYEKAQKMGLKL